MQDPKKCNPASYETRGKRKADRISGKERWRARNHTNKDKRNSDSTKRCNNDPDWVSNGKQTV